MGNLSIDKLKINKDIFTYRFSIKDMWVGWFNYLDQRLHLPQVLGFFVQWDL